MTNAFDQYRFCVAPMMEWTDRHCRVFHRLLSRHARLYTEMVTANAILHGLRARLIGFDAREQPVAIQLGGCEPAALAEAAKIAEDFGYIEVNLNVGCPSDRVKSGAFGACLMREPDLVADCVAAMKRAVDVPVTVKCRLGVDDQEPRDALFTLADKAIAAGADALIVHARMAWLKGLSPKENREIPPLDYALVHALKREYPHMPIVINGGIASLEDARAQLAHLDGVMMGRAAYQNPEILLGVDPLLFGAPAPFTNARAALDAYLSYIRVQLRHGVPLSAMTRHLLGLFAGRPGARAFRRVLATEAVKPGANEDAVLRAVSEIDRGREKAALAA
ncbi:MAG: tRNA dihydrouridine(20/20a) synthase DusA [Methylobacteriaceae bacterium]|nr:tRNA dihydrouridine(20/20a) synthase DusA [Methylobacteriaceae bacterium]